MQLSSSEESSLVGSLKSAFNCSPANLMFCESKVDRRDYESALRMSKACDRVSKAFFHVTKHNNIQTYGQLQKSVSIYFGWLAWLFIKWAAPRILAFLWERTHDKRAN